MFNGQLDKMVISIKGTDIYQNTMTFSDTAAAVF